MRGDPLGVNCGHCDDGRLLGREGTPLFCPFCGTVTAAAETADGTTSTILKRLAPLLATAANTR